MRRWAIVAVVGVLIVTALVIVLTRGGEQENAAAAAWQDDLVGWEDEQAEALVLPDGPALHTVVTGEAMSPIGGEGTHESVEEVNAACTRVTAFAEQVRNAPGPPAIPADADVTPEQTEAFEADLAALTAFQQAMQEPAATLAQFCGSYPVLISAHQGDDAEQSRQRFAQSLDTQCPLADLADACTALSAGAQAAGGSQDAEPESIDPARIRQVIEAELTAAESEIDGAAAAFAAALTVA